MNEHLANSSAMQDEPKPEVPDFDLIRPIGRGGFGQVWLGRNQTTGHLRAVKLIALRAADSADPATREITSLTRLEAAVRQEHPNLVTIHHIGRTADHLFYVMELADDVSGAPASAEADYRPATLETRLREDPPTPDECVRFARELLTGLASLHAAGMVHRDVKPANCLFVRGNLKLADFGLLTEDNPQVSRVGTRTYMPPDGRMDLRADVYAAGLVIYEMLTGLPADRFPHLGRRAHRIVTHPRLNALVRLALRACQPEPHERYESAARMVTALRGERNAAVTRSKPPRYVIAAAVCLALLIVAGSLWFQPWQRTVPPTEPSRPSASPAVKRVDINFITESPNFDAEIYLDGKRLDGPDGPYKTPITVPGLSAKAYRVVFKLPGIPDLELGTIDFDQTHQIVGRWPHREPTP